MTSCNRIVIATVLALCFITIAECGIRCRLLEVDIQYERELPPSATNNHHQVHCEPENESGATFEIENVPPGFSVANNPYADIIGGVLDRDNAKVLMPPGAYISALKNKNRRSDSSRRRTGTRSTLVVRVTAPDGQTTASAASLSDSVFGTNGDPVNLKTQYEDCSAGQLVFEPYNGVTSTGQQISGGVAEVDITQTVTGVDEGIVRNAVTNAVVAKYGSTSQWNHLMYCLPAGTNGGWIAYAYINSQISVYNNQWCTYVSAQMHELGHNINLAHSGEAGSTYADQSGMMGYSYSQDDGPVMCFNNAKNWHLGWFQGCYSTVTPASEGTLTYMIGAAEYSTADQCGSGEAVVTKVGVTGGFLFIGYNKKVGNNAGTVEGGNQVTVNFAAQDSGYSTSDLRAKLSAGGSSQVDGVYIKFCSVDAGRALVGVGLTSDPCAISNCGNGAVDVASGEECDDGNLISNDGCSATCKLEFCGDGVKQSSEGCDDGNTVANDGCDSNCVAEVCGDGIVNNGEECDGDAGTPPLCSDGCAGLPKFVGCKWDTICGNGVCEASEASLACPVTASSCSDCVFEVAGSFCGDGVCDIALSGTRAKEDSFNCPADCDGITRGKPSSRFYCGNNDAGEFVGCDHDSRCTSCEMLESSDACCGDDICAVEAGETPLTCASDCAGSMCSSNTECTDPSTPYCESSVCVECNDDAQCDDGLFCTVDTCNVGMCSHGPGTCLDGEVCDEEGDVCKLPEPCTVSADFPGCCCDNALSTLSGQKQSRTCVDNGSEFLYGTNCLALGSAAHQGVEHDATTTVGEPSASVRLDALTSTLLVAVAALAVAVGVLVLLLALLMRRLSKASSTPMALFPAPSAEPSLWGAGSSLVATPGPKAQAAELVLAAPSYVPASRDLEAAVGAVDERRAEAGGGLGWHDSRAA